ncbi:MAG: hypothetical protein GY931_07995 [Maribacter sp.]|nr:hypothetical protein [Maribacter sp.]
MVEGDQKQNHSETVPGKEEWSNIITVVGSPLKLFSLIILVCSTVFCIFAGISDDKENFKYTIHMFLGIVAGFLLLALWCPKLLYHPKELQGLGEDTADSLESKPIVPTVLITLGAVGYIFYQKYNC